MDFKQIIETAGQYMDFAGVAIMLVSAVASIPLAIRGRSFSEGGGMPERQSVYRQYRQLLGRSILRGRELLVAADIIRTVAVTPTFTSVASSLSLCSSGLF